MHMAILEARKNVSKRSAGGPFGACIVRSGKVISIARNTVLKNDATCHAEMNAIRLASRKLKNFDLSGCEIYSTTEPCPMCFSAIHWAGIKILYYGTCIADVKRLGFNELPISNKKMRRLGHSSVLIRENCLRAECMKLLKSWGSLPKKAIY